jgi:hypothetical protein
VLLLASTPLFAAGCKRSTEQHARRDAPPAPLVATQTVRERGVHFRVPATWARLQQPAVAVAMVAPETLGIGFHPNVNVVIEPFDADVAALADQNAKTIATAGGIVVDRQKARAGTLDAVDLETRWPDRRPAVRTLQRYAVSGGKAYVMGCTLPLETEAARPTCTAILETFEIDP